MNRTCALWKSAMTLRAGIDAHFPATGTQPKADGEEGMAAMRALTVD